MRAFRTRFIAGLGASALSLCFVCSLLAPAPVHARLVGLAPGSFGETAYLKCEAAPALAVYDPVDIGGFSGGSAPTTLISGRGLPLLVWPSDAFDRLCGPAPFAASP